MKQSHFQQHVTSLGTGHCCSRPLNSLNRVQVILGAATFRRPGLQVRALGLPTAKKTGLICMFFSSFLVDAAQSLGQLQTKQDGGLCQV
jgi:hypothetical protein